MRNGVKMEVPTLKNVSRQRKDSFPVMGCQLFNYLPQELRELDVTMDTYDENLDQYLSFVHNRPRIGEENKDHTNVLDMMIRVDIVTVVMMLIVSYYLSILS